MDEEEELRATQTALIAESVRVVLRGYAIADGNTDRVMVGASCAYFPCTIPRVPRDSCRGVPNPEWLKLPVFLNLRLWVCVNMIMMRSHTHVYMLHLCPVLVAGIFQHSLCHACILIMRTGRPIAPLRHACCCRLPP